MRNPRNEVERVLVSIPRDFIRMQIKLIFLRTSVQ